MPYKGFRRSRLKNMFEDMGKIMLVVVMVTSQLDMATVLWLRVVNLCIFISTSYIQMETLNCPMPCNALGQVPNLISTSYTQVEISSSSMQCPALPLFNRKLLSGPTISTALLTVVWWSWTSYCQRESFSSAAIYTVGNSQKNLIFF